IQHSKRTMEKQQLEQDLNLYFNEEYEGRYSPSIDVDHEEEVATLSIAFEEGSDRPNIGKFVDQIIDRLESDNIRMEADWSPKHRLYTVNIYGKD
ncbi:MAG: hypothetical protein ACLFRK_01760, partial [Candidatus Nanohaloarchaea archaeon]